MKMWYILAIESIYRELPLRPLCRITTEAVASELPLKWLLLKSEIGKNFVQLVAPTSPIFVDLQGWWLCTILRPHRSRQE